VIDQSITSTARNKTARRKIAAISLATGSTAKHPTSAYPVGPRTTTKTKQYSVDTFAA
jgi:hypothetical protein